VCNDNSTLASRKGDGVVWEDGDVGIGALAVNSANGYWISSGIFQIAFGFCYLVLVRGD